MPIFDTSFLIDLTRGDEGAVTIAKQVDSGSDFEAVSVVTVHESLRDVFYHHMGEKSLDKKIRKALTDLAHFEQLEFISTIAREAALLDAELFRKGTMIPYADVIIAAAAIHHKSSLVTRDIHFHSVDDLDIIEY